MNYRSDVAIAMKETDFRAMITKAKAENGLAYNLIRGAERVQKQDNIVTVFWTWMKWYDGYEEIDFINHFLLDEADGYGFARVGEDDADVEETFSESEDGGTFYDYVYVRRDIFTGDGDPVEIAEFDNTSDLEDEKRD